MKQELKRSVLWPLRLPHLFKGYRQPPKTFLLVGPPGKYNLILVSSRQGRLWHLNATWLANTCQFICTCRYALASTGTGKTMLVEKVGKTDGVQVPVLTVF